MVQCNKCGSDKTMSTGVVCYSNPPQYEYYCEDCKEKFLIIKDKDIQEQKDEVEVIHRPDLKGCFNCNFYNPNTDMTVFLCTKLHKKTNYTDVCKLWSILKEA